ncbi:hypothetical protein DV737_g703, partial [Chaetothyriales sp. CBS 132003]
MHYISALALLALSQPSLAGVSVYDPSDDYDVSVDASDNTILQDWDYEPTSYQVFTIEGPEYLDGVNTTISHQTFSVDANDTSVVVITDDSTVTLEYVTIVKEGFSTDLYQSSFFGVNAAVNVANGSVATISHSNITVHNGAANIYSYGDGTVVYADNLWLYSSGPVSHGVYASGNGTIYGTNLVHYSGGYRSSAFAGDVPEGYVYINDSVAHTKGYGSAIFYALGTIEAHNVVGYAEKSTTVFMDAGQTASIYNSDITAGFFGGIVLFSSGTKESGASVTFVDSILSTVGDVAALTVGNVVADIWVQRTQLNPGNGVLATANTSQVTQDFDHWIESGTGDAYVYISESTLEGEIIAYNGSTISWYLGNYSTWTGTGSVVDYTINSTTTSSSAINVYIDETSTWTLTADTTVYNFTDAVANLSNVVGNGYNLYYDSSASANAWLDAATISLSGGGSATPA